jgi:isoquinoline 1-oxidoreductase beta subunit
MKLITTKHNRRSFLKVSTAAGGGMMLGFSWFAGCKPATLEEATKAVPSAWYDINSYIKIGDTGLVTIMSPNPEIGQNVKTSMPMLIAEELDVRWKDVVVEQAGLNTEWYSRQVAGGSQSIRQGWESLRMAGATAKEMLKNAAAKRWGVDPAELTVSEGVFTNANGETLGYGEVASEAATMKVPETVPLKDVKDFKIIGYDTPNVDIDNIITGKPLFGLDTQKEGMKYATVVRPPSFGQKLVSIDDSEALKVNGVESVYQIRVPLKEGREVDKVAVVANSTWAAMKGQKALKTVWEVETPAESSAEHNKKMMDVIGTLAEEPVRRNGNPEKAFQEADEVLERTYEAPFLPHNCMEPMNFFADVNGETVELLGPIQTPQWTRSRVVDLLGMVEKTGDEEKDKAAYDEAFKKVNLQMTRMGGGFGRRLYGDFAIEAAQISKIAKAPIKVVFSREDDMLAGTYRPSTKYRIRAAIKDNKITAYHLTEVGVNGNMWDALADGFPAGALNDYRIDRHQVDSNITVGAWRAPYTNFLASAEQSFFDELAEKLGQDAVQMRLDLLTKAVENYEKHAKIDKDLEDEKKRGIEPKSEEEIAELKKDLLPKGNYEPEKFIGVIKLAAEKAGWGKAPAGVHQGFSVFYSHNTYVAEVADVVMENGKPKVKKMTCAVDCGIVVNPIAAKNQVEGGIIDGVGHAMFGDFSFEDGKAIHKNFDSYRMIRMGEAPEVEVHFVKNENNPTGLGEPSFPPAGGAIANALHKATGERLYIQPYVKSSKVLG